MAYSIPTFSEFAFHQVAAARDAGTANLLIIARKQFPNIDLYKSDFFYKGQLYRFFFNHVTMRQDFCTVRD